MKYSVNENRKHVRRLASSEKTSGRAKYSEGMQLGMGEAPRCWDEDTRKDVRTYTRTEYKEPYTAEGREKGEGWACVGWLVQ